MKTIITINMDNAAFDDYPTLELTRILTKLVFQLENEPYYLPGLSLPIHDSNGNRVGQLEVREES